MIRGTAANERGLESSCDVLVDAAPTGPDAICPADVSTVALNPISLTGRGVDDGEITGYLWEMISKPEPSAAAPPFPNDSAVTGFTPDVTGIYGIRFTVRDDDGNSDSCEFTVTATPSEGLRIEIWWNPPDRSCDQDDPVRDCDPTDVDLHLLHPDAPNWFHGTYDCYYANCTPSSARPDWDSPGSEDDPRLDVDDVEGHGPENINIDLPATGNEYLVGVHYFYDEGYGPVPVYVRIYCSTISIDPVAEFGPVRLSRSGVDFWRVASVRWTGVTCTAESLERPNGAPDIITQDEAARRR